MRRILTVVGAAGRGTEEGGALGVRQQAGPSRGSHRGGGYVLAMRPQLQLHPCDEPPPASYLSARSCHNSVQRSGPRYAQAEAVGDFQNVGHQGSWYALSPSSPYAAACRSARGDEAYNQATNPPAYLYLPLRAAQVCTKAWTGTHTPKRSSNFTGLRAFSFRVRAHHTRLVNAISADK
jgi:hypothetical protein